jgi:secreted trypsin-like serine protease
MKSHLLPFYILFFTFFLISACAEKVDSNPVAKEGYQWNRDQSHLSDEAVCAPGTFDAGIVGGEKVKKTSWVSRGTVFILQKESHQTASCSGTLIDRNIVLTAAHCVDQSVDSPQKVSVYFSNQPECDRDHDVLEGKKRSVEAIEIHPSWNTNSPRAIGHGDIAILRIEGEAPSQFKAVPLSSEFLLSPTSQILLAGFGMVNPDYYGSFGAPVSLRAAYTQPLAPAQKNYLLSLTSVDRNPSISELHEYDNSPTNELLYIDQTQGDGICGGDSGGPSFMKNSSGDYVLIGVASFVMNPFDASLLCGYAAAHTNVLYMRDWIEQSFLKIRNSISEKRSPFQ